MRAREEEKAIVDIRLLAEQLNLSPEETQGICRRLFWKIADLRERAANVDVGAIADHAKEFGGKSTSEVQGLVERVRDRFTRSKRIEPTAEVEG